MVKIVFNNGKEQVGYRNLSLVSALEWLQLLRVSPMFTFNGRLLYYIGSHSDIPADFTEELHINVSVQEESQSE